MKRRTFLATAAGAASASLLPIAARASMVNYEPGLINERLDAGETLFLDFFADWCGTCQAQRRVITALWEENPAYLEKITFIDVDWDTYGRSELSMSMNIPRRSTLVALAPDRTEIGRLVAQTGRDDIKGLMDQAFAVASGAA
ncbi:MAG TPA: thioredoxin [Rhodobacteraceae bacterium]|nr:thioredoxin [Paracoccaceae bacterium]